MAQIPPGTYRVGNHLWGTCSDCGKAVKVTGWLRGIHLCLTPDELAVKRDMDDRTRRQRDAVAHTPENTLRQLIGTR